MDFPSSLLPLKYHPQLGVMKQILHAVHALITLHVHRVQLERDDLLNFWIAVAAEAHEDLVVEQNDVGFLLVAPSQIVVLLLQFLHLLLHVVSSPLCLLARFAHGDVVTLATSPILIRAFVNAFQRVLT